MEQRPIVRFQRLPHGMDLPLPQYETTHAAAVDLRAATLSKITDIPPGGIALIPTGFNVAIPVGYEGQVRPRSGLAAKFGVGIANSPGTIDADYRGEIMGIMVNFSNRTYSIHRGDRIAQLVIAPVSTAAIVEVDSLDETERGAGGFGSTGVA